MTKREELEKIKQKIIEELECELKDNSTNLVFGKGNPDAKILFIGEAPGEKEDIQGIPFVGRAGKQLDKLLNQIELTIDDVYIANILKYRPPKNRDPRPDEIIKHTPYLIEQIKIIKPQIIATLGNYATKFVLSEFNPKNMKKIEGIASLHGQVKDMEFDNTKVKIVPIYHPSAMMYRPSLKEEFENDFKIMAELIGKKFQKLENDKQKTLNNFKKD